ncbi:MAG: undecaprenyl-phosphate glucose phosphotransferase [Verrucomicrobiae bacterium]|nr:undecaprenyl-phosphate glucose phosphotransferase [Verrucomicrobiae bacterium]
MFRRKDARAYTVVLTICSDFIAMLLAFGLTWWIRFRSGLIPYGDTPLWFQYLAVVALWAVVVIMIFHIMGLYSIRTPLPFLSEVAKITQGLAISLALLFALAFFLRAQHHFSRASVLLMSVLTLSLFLLQRKLVRHYWGMFLRHHDLLQRVLLVGVGEENAHIITKIEKDIHSGRKVVGLLSDEKDLQTPHNVPLLGLPGDLPKVLDGQEVDEVILGTLQVPHGQISDWILACEKHLVQFRLVPDLFEILASRVQLDFISGVPLLGLGDFPLDRPFNRIIKRIMDIVGSVAGLILSAPIMAVAALLIRMESPGPVFYVQERCGREGRIFKLYKLRTMRVDAEKETGPVWTRENDPRRTRFGGILRKLNIDETPQFWNVLKGEMSLVGPRPERPHFVEQFKKEIRHYMPRHHCKAGITGWAQVNGLRGNTPLDERIRYDLFYFENWSLWFDLRIILATLFNFKNAY